MSDSGFTNWKCLSLKQPFANLVASGKKTVELRKWNTKFRGDFLIHASKNVMIDECTDFGLDHTVLPTGMIIGRATLYDVKHYDSGEDWLGDKDKHLAGEDFMDSMYGFMLKNAHMFSKPVPFSGQLNLFNVSFDESLLQARQYVQSKFSF